MRSLVDFLNHGALPFTGRGEELRRLLEFWRSTPEAGGLRALLLSGEAGIGKSRLIEELLPQIHRGGGIAVQIKLLPESADSIVPLVARALWYSEAGRHLLKKEPEENFGSVLAALRRLSRLRPTLLVIEDVHLLAGEGARDLWGLLEGLADETISVLCAARPIEMPARAILERYLVERVDLEGLSGDELDGLWRELFSDSPDPELVASLGEATAGNPLAVRSALRGAVSSGQLAGRDPGMTGRHDRQAFANGLKRDIELLSEGMAAHLSGEERVAAEGLASLGEAFSREAAALLIERSDEMIDRLIFKGILAVSTTPRTPLAGSDAERSDYPSSTLVLLAFTHTLVHRYFADRCRPGVARLVEIIGGDRPLYSLLPFQLLDGRYEQATEVLPSTIRAAIHRTRYVAMELSNARDWEIAMSTLRVAEGLFDALRSTWSEEERKEILVGIRVIGISITSHGNVDEEYERMALELMAMTADPRTTRAATQRMAALGKYFALKLDVPDSATMMWEEIESIVAAFPDVRFSHSYALILALIATTSVDQENTAIVRKVEERVREVLAEKEGGRVAAIMRGWVLPPCILVFETPRELEEKLALIGELERELVSSQQELMLRDAKVVILDAAGCVDELLRVVDQCQARFREYGWDGSAAKCMVARLRALAALGMDLREVAASAERACAGLRDRSLEVFRSFTGGYLAESGLLRGDVAWARRIHACYPEGEEVISPAGRIMLALDGELDARLVASINRNDPAGEVLARLLEVATEAAGADPVAAAEGAGTLLGRPLLKQFDLLAMEAAIGLIDAIERRGDRGLPDLREEIAAALAGALAWLDGLELPALITPILDRNKGRFTARALKSWRARVSALQRERSDQVTARRDDGRIRISMLGTIEIELPSGEKQRMQGARLRAVLGLMVANQMLDRPLTHREFCAIATGEESPEKARNIVYVKLHALREALGDDAIITETDDAPRLDLRRVQVDMLDAHALLADVRAAMRERALLRATPALLRALELAHGEVPFPGLYEEFFEAAREDFENALRSATIGVSKDLMREGDPHPVEEILGRCFEAMPDDQEIGELLCEALVMGGRRAEAERVRRRVAAEMEGA